MEKEIHELHAEFELLEGQNPEDKVVEILIGFLNDKKPESFTLSGVLLGSLVDEKQAAYGDSFGRSGEVMKLLYPDGIKPDQYTDALAVIRVIDKLFRVATDRDALGESPWSDVAGYGLLGARNAKRGRDGKINSCS